MFPALILHTISSVIYAHVSERAKNLEDRASSYANSYDYRESSAAISVCTRGFHVPEFIYPPIANLQILQGGRRYPEAYSLRVLAQARAKSLGLGRLMELGMCL